MVRKTLINQLEIVGASRRNEPEPCEEHANWQKKVISVYGQECNDYDILQDVGVPVRNKNSSGNEIANVNFYAVRPGIYRIR